MIHDFENIKNKINKIYWLNGVFAISLILIASITYSRGNYITYLQNSPYFSDTPPIKRYCYHAAVSFIKENAFPVFFHDDLLKKLDHHPGYAYFELEGDEAVVHVKHPATSNTCSIYLENRQGVRAFNFTWNDIKMTHPKIVDINEFSPRKNEWEVK